MVRVYRILLTTDNNMCILGYLSTQFKIRYLIIPVLWWPGEGDNAGCPRRKASERGRRAHLRLSGFILQQKLAHQLPSNKIRYNFNTKHERYRWLIRGRDASVSCWLWATTARWRKAREVLESLVFIFLLLPFLLLFLLLTNFFFTFF